MKPLFQKLPLSKGLSFIYERYVSPHFETPWHYHEEFEIVLCDDGFGKKVVGNHTSEYQKGDVLFLGSNLPHLFQADASFYQEGASVKPASLVIQFSSESFGNQFFDITEMDHVKKLFSNASLGLEFFGQSREKIAQLMRDGFEKKGLERFTALLEILQVMGESEEVKALSEIGMLGLSSKDSERMHAVFDLLFNNFKEDITVEHAASLTHFSRPAFCRYFKARTQKTFVEYLTDVRINHACKLLRETNLSVLEICYESGFNNLSNFNRQFRRKVNCPPQQFRKLTG